MKLRLSPVGHKRADTVNPKRIAPLSLCYWVVQVLGQLSPLLDKWENGLVTLARLRIGWVSA